MREMPTRRSLIVGAGLAAAAVNIVRAESLLEIPGDPLSARGLFAAAKWATEEFNERPGCRIVFADGQSTRWMNYECMSRPSLTDASQRTYAVAIEVCVTDAKGKRFINSVPVDGLTLSKSRADRQREVLAKWIV